LKNFFEKWHLDPSLEIPFAKEEIEKFLNFLCANSKHHKIYFLWCTYLKDEKDDMVLELAVSSNSDYIITFNKKNFVGVEKFGIQILTPKKILEKMGEISNVRLENCNNYSLFFPCSPALHREE
jgi:predicted nucleic acid-binding protein